MHHASPPPCSIAWARHRSSDAAPSPWAPHLGQWGRAAGPVPAGAPSGAAPRGVGELLKGLDAEGRTLGDLTAGEWSAFGLPEGATLLDPDRAVAVRAVPGGPSPASVRTQADALERMLDARL